jgi:histidyl-tRNA synthetase
MSSTKPVRGMRDFPPADKARREHVLSSIRSSYASHGFVEIETPYLESLDHLVSDQGGDNEKMLFKVQKRGLDAAELQTAASPDDLCDIGLRYDLTVGLSRFYANSRGKIPDVFRCMHIGPVWRAERPQKGRYRQFTQCDIDIVGEPTSLAEVELITTTIKALSDLGLHDLTLKLNDRRLLTALLREVNAPQPLWSRCLISIDKLDKIGIAGVTDELAEFVDNTVVVRLSEAIAAFEDSGFDTAHFRELVSQPEVTELTANIDRILQAVGDGISPAPVKLRFDGSLVRGMGYYSGPIFELWHPSFKGAVSGGGRYDGMIGRFSGTDVPASGFSIGFERIVDLVELPRAGHGERIAVVYDEDIDWGTVVRIQASLIDQGKCARLVPRPKRLGPLLDVLAAENFTSWLEAAKDGTVGDVRPLRA